MKTSLLARDLPTSSLKFSRSSREISHRVAGDNRLERFGEQRPLIGKEKSLSVLVTFNIRGFPKSLPNYLEHVQEDFLAGF